MFFHGIYILVHLPQGIVEPGRNFNIISRKYINNSLLIKIESEDFLMYWKIEKVMSFFNTIKL